MPEAKFRQLGIASRSTFWRWGRQGLRILKVGGRRFIRESDLTAFLEQKAAEGEVNRTDDRANPAENQMKTHEPNPPRD